MFSPEPRSLRGFTLIEMMVSVTILTIIMGVIFTLTQQTAKVYKDTSGQMESFSAARAAFESMTRNLSLATLNNYYDYVNSAGVTRSQAIRAGTANSFSPTTYGRSSDLHFVSGPGFWTRQITHSVFFQSPLGYVTTSGLNQLENLLNSCGYYIEYRSDTGKPSFVPSPAVYRYCLMEFIQPADQMSVYTSTGTSWFTGPLGSTTPPVHQIAPNIIGLVIRPRSSSGDSGGGAADPIANTVTDYLYDTRANMAPVIHNQLPPILEVVIVAIDEASATRFPNVATPPAEIQTALTANHRFEFSADLETDLHDLETDLTGQHISFRTFRTLVPLRNSKWSNQ